MNVPRSRLLAVAAATAFVFASLTGSSVTAAEHAWEPFEVDAETSCADGSDVGFLERRADPRKVVLYFEGGGACFSAETCGFDSPDKSYLSSSEATPEMLAQRGGIFDAANPENPLAEYSFVYVPYCTGDAHLGTRTARYDDALTVEHKGYLNGTAALDHLVTSYPDVAELVVTGVSAGSIPTPLFAGLAADALPDTRIVSLGDGSGAFPDEPVLNALIGTLWGTEAAIPDWPSTDSVTLREWGIPGLYRYAGQHAPDVTFARFDYAYDETQTFYAGLVGVAADELLSLIEANDAEIAAAGVDLASFTAAGSDHTVLWRDELYALEVDGVRLIDWLADLVNGETPPDVRCGDCR